ncbi:hypothetical protein ABE142_10195 [Paenibacillus alvei]|uniref:hypothetical protein n=1 Tax=Paenibacillus alvei TaxID=44250 RepID=UPI0018CCDC54|nr:hypothetical protein [Paenibacillus alvei]MBG9733340.1 hypothetical protein [Paenibacillus alvei]MBG9745101.1 hypothetical protein [Paenibacillus alvei]MCY7486926.1 hypothetical protein [Paenibacillus alvei]MCY9580786.1 hypothetical protein [Paenibacillus alvei]MCY9585268.1 hypothetical protein [Paenibacillus alvei]
MSKFGDYYRASSFIVKKTRPVYYLFDRFPVRIPYRWLSLNQMHQMKEKLVLNYSDSELRTLKAVVNSQMESKKNFGPNNILITVFITGVFTFLISFFISYINFVGQIYSMSLRGDIKDMTILNEFEELNNSISGSKLEEILTKLFIDNMKGYYNFFFVAFAFIIIYILWYKISFMRLVKLDNIISQSIEEKKLMGNNNNFKG